MKLRCSSYFLFALALTIFSARANNILQNPDFNEGQASWATYGDGAPSVDITDGSPSSPALQVASTIVSDGSSYIHLTQCVPLADSPPPWDFGMRVRVVGGSVANGCQVYVYAAIDTGTCDAHGGNIGVPANPIGVATGLLGSFTQYSATTDDVNPFGPSKSVTFAVDAACTIGNTVTINLDHAYFGTSGTTPVRLQSFYVE